MKMLNTGIRIKYAKQKLKRILKRRFVAGFDFDDQLSANKKVLVIFCERFVIGRGACLSVF